jgi:Zn finger protein HypA/HybF involved in hydrogenase expression
MTALNKWTQTGHGTEVVPNDNQFEVLKRRAIARGIKVLKVEVLKQELWCWTYEGLRESGFGEERDAWHACFERLALFAPGRLVCISRPFDIEDDSTKEDRRVRYRQGEIRLLNGQHVVFDVRVIEDGVGQGANRIEVERIRLESCMCLTEAMDRVAELKREPIVHRNNSGMAARNVLNGNRAEWVTA